MSEKKVVLEESDLNDLEKAEIRKAFFMLDRNGDGSIDASELKAVMESVTGEEPAEADLQKIFFQLDSNNNGKVEYKEFVLALATWLKDYRVASDGDRKRKRDDSEREEVHKKIKGFFSQFRPSETFDDVRQKLVLQTGIGGPAGLSSAYHSYPPGWISNLPTDKRGEILSFCKETPNLSTALEALSSANTHQQLDAVRYVLKLLSIVEVFSTPQERRLVAEVIINIYQLIIERGVIGKLVQFLNSPALTVQHEALSALSLIAPGPRIAGCPTDSVLHPSNMFFKKIIISEGAIPMIIKLLASMDQKVKEQAVILLGTLASYNWEIRDIILKHNVVYPLCALVSPYSTMTLLRKLSWTLSVLCGVTHSYQHLPPFEKITPCLPTIGTLLFSQDPDQLVHICKSLAILLPGVPDPGICRRLINLLRVEDERYVEVQQSALHTIANLFRLDHVQSNFLIEGDILLILKELFKKQDIHLRIQVCNVLVQIARDKQRITDMIKSDYIPLLLNLMSYDDKLRFKVAKVFKYLTKGSQAEVSFMVELGCIKSLSLSLSHFKVYDSVMTEVYKFYGSSWNFDFARDTAVSLLQILMLEEVPNAQQPNKWALKFDPNCVDKIASLYSNIKESSAAVVSKGESAYHRMESNVEKLLLLIKRAHDLNSAESTSLHISKMIADLWFKHKTDHTLLLDERKTIGLKCYLGDDLRVVEVPSNVEIKQLMSELSQRYQKSLDNFALTYLDAEGDYVTLDSAETLKKLISNSLRQNKAPKIFLKTVPTATSSVSSQTSNSDPQSSSLFSSPFSSSTFKDSFKDSSSSQTHSSSSQSAIPTVTSSPPTPPASPPTPPSSPPSSPDNKKGKRKVSFAKDVEKLRRDKSILFETLAEVTHFSKKEIETLKEQWEQHSQAGYIGKDTFSNGLKSLGIVDPLTIEQNFFAFDKNKDGKINFKEFVSGLSIVLRGSVQERINLMFNLYDSDGSGFLNEEEVVNMTMSGMRIKGLPDSDKEEQIQNTVKEIFTTMDENKDGKISLEEFKTGVTNNKLLLSCFGFYQPV